MQRKVISHELGREQVTAIDEAENITEALSAVQAFKPDLIASALYFEDGTAMDLLQQLKASPDLADTPFMLVSSETRREQLEGFKQAGVVAILPKPFTDHHLRSALRATVDLLAPQEMELETYDVHTLKALVVDDSSLARRMVIRVLNNLGIEEIIEAEDGAEAQMLLADTQVDFVVTDYNMPHVDGAELTQYIRNTEGISHLPVLMVTSEQDETKLSHLNHCGIDALIDKPFSTKAVKQLLRGILEH